MVKFGEKKSTDDSSKTVISSTTQNSVENGEKHQSDTFFDVETKERKEIEEHVRKQEEKEKKQKVIRPLPGIEDWTRHPSQSLHQLEQDKRTLEIYKEIRTLRRKYRGSVIDFEKKLRKRERLKEQEKLEKERLEKERREKEVQEIEKKRIEEEKAVQERAKVEQSRVNQFVSESIGSPAPKPEEKKSDITSPRPILESPTPTVDQHVKASKEAVDKSIDEFFN